MLIFLSSLRNARNGYFDWMFWYALNGVSQTQLPQYKRSPGLDRLFPAVHRQHSD